MEQGIGRVRRFYVPLGVHKPALKRADPFTHRCSSGGAYAPLLEVSVLSEHCESAEGYFAPALPRAAVEGKISDLITTGTAPDVSNIAPMSM